MANTNAAYGFRPVSLHGTDPVFNVYAPDGYSIASGYGTSLFYGDPVKSSGTADTLGRPGIIIAPAGAVAGVFGGVYYTDANGEVQFSEMWPASTTATNIKAIVYDHPETIFSIQADESLAATDVKNKTDFVSGTGNTLTKKSGYQLDSSQIGTDDALLILGLDNTWIPNDFGTNAKALVMFREHEMGPTLTAL